MMYVFLGFFKLIEIIIVLLIYINILYMLNLLFYMSVPITLLSGGTVEVVGLPKFWLLQNLNDTLIDIGVSAQISNAIVFVVTILVLAGIGWLLSLIIGRLSFLFVKDQTLNSKSGIFKILMKYSFFKRFFVLIAIIVVVFSSRVLFSGFSADWIQFILALSRSVMIIWILLVLYSLLDAWNTFFELHPKTQQKSLKGYIQVMKIIFGVIAVVFIIATIVGKEPSNLLVGFGATAAFITLIFKDTILGFVASIQLSFQDMVRPGDWIEMPSKNADGLIVDINLSSVKVQNWDNSVTMIPIYAMVSDSFTNWRRMELGPGRLFVRTFNVDTKSVKFADESLLESLSQHPVTSANYAESLALAHVSSPAAMLTNLALFRAQLELFLRKHPQINDDLMLFVRYLHAISGEGIGLEIYAFSREKGASGYDIIHRSVMEYVISVASLFELTLFQSPSGDDFHRIAKSRGEKLSS